MDSGSSHATMGIMSLIGQSASRSPCGLVRFGVCGVFWQTVAIHTAIGGKGH